MNFETKKYCLDKLNSDISKLEKLTKGLDIKIKNHNSELEQNKKKLEEVKKTLKELTDIKETIK